MTRVEQLPRLARGVRDVREDLSVIAQQSPPHPPGTAFISSPGQPHTTKIPSAEKPDKTQTTLQEGLRFPCKKKKKKKKENPEYMLTSVTIKI